MKRFYINAAGAVACIIENNDGDILLTRRAFDPSKGKLDLPGGFIDLDETAEDAVKREVKEELNLEVTSLQYIGSSPNKYSYGGLVYFTLDLGVVDTQIFEISNYTFKNVDGYLFLPLSSIDMQEIAFPSIRNILQMVKKTI